MNVPITASRILQRSGGGQTAAQIASAFASRVEADGGVTESLACMRERITLLKNLGLWNKASAAWLPHGYAEGKLYAAKGGPEADLTISRNSTRTRKGPTYVEEVPYNLLKYSDNFGDSTWSKVFSTVTTGTTFNEEAGATSANVNQIVSKSSDAIQYTACVNVKPLGRNWVVLSLFDGTADGVRVWFNVTTGIVGASANIGAGFTNVTASIEEQEDGFYKCIITATSTTTTSLGLFINSAETNANLTFSASAIGAALELGEAQLVTGSSTRTHFSTTDRLNVPAIDYTNDTCPALSLEPVRTNRCRESEALGITPWGLTDVTVTPNAIEGPNGLSTADLVTNSSGSTSEVAQNISVTANAVHTVSGYFKYSSNQFIQIRFCHSTLINDAVVAWFNPLTGSVLSTQNSGTGTGVTASSEAVLDENGDETGWYRFILSGAINGGYTTGRIFIRCTNTTNSSTSPGQAYYATGLQLEAGSYATSYIPTTTATVTRIADAVDPLTNVADLIGQTEGTLYFEGSSWVDATSKVPLVFSDGTSNNRIGVGFNTSDRIEGFIITGGVVQAVMSTAFTTGTNYKIALTYRNNNVAFFVNGVKIAEDLVANIPSCSRIGMDSGSSGSGLFYGEGRAWLLLPTALTDAEAIAATTP